MGTLLRHGDPEAWNEISGAIAQWEAVNRTKGGDNSKVGDTYKASDWDATEAQGIRRRLYKRANSGDSEAAALIRQLGTGEITVNQAAIAAGMRAKYLRVPDDEPIKVAESLVRRKGADWAAQLAVAGLFSDKSRHMEKPSSTRPKGEKLSPDPSVVRNRAIAPTCMTRG